MEEKFHYICRNPWTDHAAGLTEDYEWVWTFNEMGALPGSAPFEGASAGFQPVPSSPATNIKEGVATPSKPQPEDGGTARGISLEAKPGTLEACATQFSQISGAFRISNGFVKAMAGGRTPEANGDPPGRVSSTAIPETL